MRCAGTQKETPKAKKKKPTGEGAGWWELLERQRGRENTVFSVGSEGKWAQRGPPELSFNQATVCSKLGGEMEERKPPHTKNLGSIAKGKASGSHTVRNTL